jgi:uncharacterized membrane protein
MLSKKILIAMGALGIVQSLYYYTLLPERVAIHFGSGGIPNSWAGSEVNLVISIFLYAFLAGIFLAIPSSLNKMPLHLISLPNREYWLAEERKESTIKQMAGLFHLFGTALIIFFLIIGHLVFRANMSSPVAFNEDIAWGMAVCLFIFTVIWLFVLVRRFRLPNTADQ